MQEESYRELIGRCLNHERAAQEELYKLHCDKMFSVCMYYAEDRDEASDFLQEGYIKIFKKLHTYNFNGSFEGWVRRIIVNTALGHIRKKSKIRDAFTYVEDIPDTADIEPAEVDVVPTAKVVELVNQLPDKAALVLKLFAIEGYSHQEIAEILDITVGTSKSQLNRARTLLKEAIKGHK
ncbi:sigma-70 family RNA polymerase sigma factor [Paracrocinitomix mangrovi]|uniref:RNA polymerase sigma factor n=1 Tax=Paracrocinitomix mangrovi TaxID=2862509 RepID=UPI001C8DFF45|nr:sigma-70 family RNA polymerase sigma factor [Paracrocinitomix mangrovi]UKN00118.1 sigma-70 family RNA polymerase sigma factor [Paracrocinitomix mangrovi]